TASPIASIQATSGAWGSASDLRAAFNNDSAYIQGYPGSVPRTVTSKLQELVSVRDFGAKGDGTTDDTAAIQATVGAACSNNTPKVYAPSGLYLLGSAGIVIPNACSLEFYGDGDHTQFPVAIGMTFVSPNPAQMAGAGVFMCLSCSNVYIHDVFINGANTSLDGSDPTGGTQRAVSMANDSTHGGPLNITLQRIHVNGMQSENLYVQSAYAVGIK